MSRIPMARDTSPEIEEMIVEGYRRMKPEDKFRRIIELNRSVEEMAAARIRDRYGPNLPDREIRLRLASLRLDRETMIQVFDWDPEEQGY